MTVLNRPVVIALSVCPTNIRLGSLTQNVFRYNGPNDLYPKFGASLFAYMSSLPWKRASGDLLSYRKGKRHEYPVLKIIKSVVSYSVPYKPVRYPINAVSLGLSINFFD